MAYLSVALAARNAQLNELTAAIDAAGGRRPATISIYDGAQPEPDDPPAGRLLAVLRFGYPSFHPAVDGILEAYPIAPVLAQATGKATWARIADGAGEPVGDGDVGTEASDAVLRFDSDEFVAGQPVTVNGFRLRKSR